MPGTRTHGSRSRSRPYDRRSPTASPMQPPASELSAPRASPVPVPAQDPSIPADHPGLPSYAEYKRIEAGYLHGLSPRKRDKALITQAMFDKIWDVLHQPDACTVETPQFRFWVRKMFVLSRPPAPEGVEWCGHARDADEGHEEEEEGGEGGEAEADRALERAMGIARGTDADAQLLAGPVVLHEHRPVAIMEQLYELFCFCHVRAGHGGRDKTCAVIRQHYSWVPKELTAQFVKACPTCARKRSGCGDLGGAVQRAGRQKGRTAVVVREEASADLGWLTTGGPLDPANPPPCGVRDRTPKESPPRRALSARADPGPFGDPTTHSPGTHLPSLASALSNTSLDDNVVLTGPGGDADAGGCLPPALRPLRLSGPLPVPECRSGEPDDLFQIDPALLTLSYTPISPTGMSCRPRGAEAELGYPDLIGDAFRTRACRRGASPVMMFKPRRLYGYGYEDGSGPLATMLLPCSTDSERDLDARFSIA